MTTERITMRMPKTQRERWPSGPWDNEPDKVEWIDDATGLPCLVLRHHESGHLCGYVAVPPGHPLHGQDNPRMFDDDGNENELPKPSTYDLSVHGGITYADTCEGDVCHKPAPGEPDDVWWFGFDMAHAYDLTPMRLMSGLRFGGDEYRTIAYVKEECAKLAAQLAAMK
jgi:hypothetical protein